MPEELPEQQMLDRFTRQDELLAQMIPLLQQIRDRSTETVVAPTENSSTYQQRMLELMEYAHDKEYEIRFFTFPNDGTMQSLAAGTTRLNFQNGTVKDVDDVVSDMSNSLQTLRIDFLRSLAISADQDIIIQIDNGDMIPITAGIWFRGTFLQYQQVDIITSRTKTEVFALACTHPDAINIGGASVRFSGTLVDAKSGTAVAAESAAVAFDRVVNRVRVIANDYDMYIRTSADGTNWEDQIHVKADVEQVFDVACHSFKVQRYGVNDAVYEVEGYR